MRIKGRYDPVIHGYRYANIVIGLNCTYQEATMPTNIIRIPIPFMKNNIYFIRYKKIIPSNHRCMVEKRLEDQINNELDKTTLNTGKEIIKYTLKHLNYLKTGDVT